MCWGKGRLYDCCLRVLLICVEVASALSLSLSLCVPWCMCACVCVALLYCFALLENCTKRHSLLLWLFVVLLFFFFVFFFFLATIHAISLTTFMTRNVDTLACACVRGVGMGFRCDDDCVFSEREKDRHKDAQRSREAKKQKLGRGDVVRWAIYSLERRTG